MQQVTTTNIYKQPSPFSVDVVEPHVHKWTTEEYYRMTEIGLFDGKRVELIGGEIIEMAAMNVAHATSITLVNKLLQKIFAEGFAIRVQVPLSFDNGEEPEPDVAVVIGKARDYNKFHPASAVLVIEIAESSLIYDQTTKASLYAKNGIQDYWNINLRNRRLEVYRQPLEDLNAAFGLSYANTQILTEKDVVSPLAMPDAQIAVADLLP